MDFKLKKADPATGAIGALALGVFEKDASLTPAAAALDRAAKGALRALLASGDFTGKHLETAVLHAPGIRARRVIVLGLGPRAAFTPQRALLVAAQAARRARELSAGSLALAFDAAKLDAAAFVAALGEGAVLGHYRHTAYRTSPAPALTRVEVWSAAAPGRSLAAALARGVARGEAVCIARDLANTPGQDLVPEQLAQRAREVGKRAGAKVTVFDVAAMERLGMGCVLAVGRGSANPPRFIVMDRPAAKSRSGKPRTIVIVGKGVTFDTGGYSLKPRQGMSKMKYDMGGAAAVLGCFAGLAALGPLPVRIVGLIPSAENMVGGEAVKPGDVVRALDGTTIEITNTDAEGRLLLADALGYAQRLQPDTVIDLATLTGAISIALGRQYAGLFTADEALAAELLAAGESVHERLWRMPMNDEYLAEMKSDTADLVNSNEKPEGGSSLAASFLMHFARGMRWAHLDIASVGWTYAERADSPRGANGFGARLLLRWLETRTGR